MPESVRGTQLRSRIGSVAPSPQVLTQRKVSPPFVGSQCHATIEHLLRFDELST